MSGSFAPTLRRHPALVHLSLLVVALFWGVTFVAVKYLVERIGPILSLIHISEPTRPY